jgi:hypothetical protein
MKNTLAVIGIVVLVVLIIGLPIFFGATPMGKAMWNNWFHEVQKVDDATNYETLKKVEDTCRAMISSYNADKLTYEQYKDSDNEEKQEWAEQAKMRANKTASTYNNYILENEYVWKGNVPSDIRHNLPYID